MGQYGSNMDHLRKGLENMAAAFSPEEKILQLYNAFKGISEITQERSKRIYFELEHLFSDYAGLGSSETIEEGKEISIEGYDKIVAEYRNLYAALENDI